jgi:hypothetical protein
MDVRYIIEATVPTKSDAVVVAAMAGVDITPVLKERQTQFTVCSDNTAISAPGTIQRTIIAELTTEFESHFPTLNDQLKALRGAFKNRFSKMLPARVEESVSVGAFCP